MCTYPQYESCSTNIQYCLNFCLWHILSVKYIMHCCKVWSATITWSNDHWLWLFLFNTIYFTMTSTLVMVVSSREFSKKNAFVLEWLDVTSWQFLLWKSLDSVMCAEAFWVKVMIFTVQRESFVFVFNLKCFWIRTTEKVDSSKHGLLDFDQSV